MTQCIPHLLKQLHFTADKQKAIGLLEWALDDISPDREHRLHMKVGIEREGSFIDPQLKDLGKFENIHDWFSRSQAKIKRMAAIMELDMKDRAHELGLDRIYHDESGTFLLELNTLPMSPTKAPAAAIAIGKEMERLARNQGVKDISFGTLKANFLAQMADRFGPDFYSEFGGMPPYYFGQVFNAEPMHGGPDDVVLAGRGQHCNVSVWCGDKNLYAVEDRVVPDRKTSGSEVPHVPNRLGAAVVLEACKTLPSMTMLARNRNYYRLQDDGFIMATTEIGVSANNKSECAMNWVDRKRKGQEGAKEQFVRMEFRHAASDADPYDVVLSSLIPTVKACLKHAQLGEDGKIQIDEHGLPVFKIERLRGYETKPVSPTHEAAAAQFNTSHNHNFTFLDELAERKYARAQQDANAHPGSMQHKHELREAASLRGIGTRLHHQYCQQYDMVSMMPPPPKQTLISA